jgi:integrase
LSEDDLRKFWDALSVERPVVAAALKLRLVTAQRGGEVLAMRWRDVELASGWWTIPAERSKNALPHRVPLADAAVDILRTLKASDSVWVFPSPTRDGPLRSTQKAIERIRRRAGIELRGHDLRRTAASCMTSMGVPRLVVGKILNHVETGVTAVYDRHSYDREKRDALDAWSKRLQVILQRSPRSRVEDILPPVQGRP